MTAQSAGWIVRIREWGRDDVHYFAAISDQASAEEQVRDAAQPDPQATVEALTELRAHDLARHKLTLGKIMLAPKGSC